MDKVKKWFDKLPTQVKIIIFQAVANVLWTVSEWGANPRPFTWYEIGVAFVRFLSTTAFNLVTWYLLTLKEEQK